MDAVTQSLINSMVIAVFGAVLTFLSMFFWKKRDALITEAARIADENAALVKRVQDLEAQSALLKQAVQPISVAMQALLIKELTHYHTPEMDALLVKVGPPNILTDAEQQRLIVLLTERTKDMDGRISDEERDAADILPAIMRRAKVELDAKQDVELKIVALPPEPAVHEDRSTEDD